MVGKQLSLEYLRFASTRLQQQREKFGMPELSCKKYSSGTIYGF
jgi:hypothetical protein